MFKSKKVKFRKNSTHFKDLSNKQSIDCKAMMYDDVKVKVQL